MLRNFYHTSRQASAGFTLTELVVVVAIILILMGLLVPIIGGTRLQAKISLAKSQVQYSATGAGMFGTDTNYVYPPDTADYGNGETSFDPASMYVYLGSKLSKLTNSPYILMKPEQLKSSGAGVLFVDPWGNPYHFDAFHTVNGDPNLVIGRPYDSSVPADQQVLDFKIWSNGPDGKENLGSHAIGSGTGVDADNIGSW